MSYVQLTSEESEAGVTEAGMRGGFNPEVQRLNR